MGADLCLVAVAEPVYEGVEPVDGWPQSPTPDAEYVIEQLTERIADLPDDLVLQIGDGLCILDDLLVEEPELQEQFDAADEPEQKIMLVMGMKRRLVEAAKKCFGPEDETGRQDITMTFGGRNYLITGGQTWGDTPSELYDDVQMLYESGVCDKPLPMDEQTRAQWAL